MLLDRNKLYSILLIACVVGYIWLYYSITSNVTKNKSVEVCLIKHATNIPCPSCGTTRAVMSLVNGNFFEALVLNPFGYIVALIMLLAPVWIVIDLISKSSSLFTSYKKLKNFLLNPSLQSP